MRLPALRIANECVESHAREIAQRAGKGKANRV
jgi:hypothetical protein